MMMYPLGLPYRQPRLPAGAVTIFRGLNPEQRGLFHTDVDAAETPILLVHGIIDNHAIFTVMECTAPPRLPNAVHLRLRPADPQHSVRRGTFGGGHCAAVHHNRL
jgi:hypothetical protein